MALFDCEQISPTVGEQTQLEEVLNPHYNVKYTNRISAVYVFPTNVLRVSSIFMNCEIALIQLSVELDRRADFYRGDDAGGL